MPTSLFSPMNINFNSQYIKVRNRMSINMGTISFRVDTRRSMPKRNSVPGDSDFD